ncbi:MAG: hypothetical protein WA213_03155 [Terriglobales bacterium]
MKIFVQKRRFLLSALAGFVFGAMGAVNLVAQPEAAGSGVSVKMVVTAEAQRGSDVPVLDAKDVMVYEGKDRDQVTDWAPAQGDHAGLELFILLDDSSARTLATQFNDIRKFIDQQPSSVRIGVAYMRNGSAQIEQNLTSDHALATKALRLPLGIMGINASPYFALSDLVKHWPKSNDRHEVLMVSDGIDLYYGIGDLQDPYLATAIDDAQRAGVMVSAIYSPGAGHFGHDYWQTYWGQLYLAELADRTGGESYYIGLTGAPVAFSPYLDDFANRLNHQYILTFLAKPEKKAGLRRVKVTTEVPNAQLVAADQVYVPAAQ